MIIGTWCECVLWRAGAVVSESAATTCLSASPPLVRPAAGPLAQPPRLQRLMLIQG